MIFFDSNVLVYAYSVDPRRERAQAALQIGGSISAQVLNEVTDVLRKKQKQDWQTVDGILQAIHFMFDDIRPLTADLHAHAVQLARAYNFTFYDALIVAAALEARCDRLFSEDFQHGLVIDVLRIENPFL